MTRTATIPFNELLAFGDRQKKGELQMFGLTVLDHGYKVEFDDLAGEAEIDAAIPCACLATCSTAKPDADKSNKIGNAGENPAASPNVAVVQEQKNINIQAGETLVEDDGSTPSSNSICPVCQTAHDSRTACNQQAIQKRFSLLLQ